MATTTNYGWTTPDDTALVKDGAAAIRSLGTAIDTTVFNNANAAIAKTLIDAKGDLIIGSAADTAARLAVGTNDYVLTADSTATNGVKWAALPAAGATFVGCFLYKTGNQSINHDTTTVLTFDAESYDTDSFHSTSTNTGRITIPSGKAGKYIVGGQVAAEAGNNGRAIFSKVNGTTSVAVWNKTESAASNTYCTWSNLYNLAVGDYIEVLYDQQSGATKNVYGASATDTAFYCVYLGA